MILLVRLMSAMRIWKSILSKNLFSSSNPTNQNPVNNSGPPSFLKRKKTILIFIVTAWTYSSSGKPEGFKMTQSTFVLALRRFGKVRHGFERNSTEAVQYT